MIDLNQVEEAVRVQFPDYLGPVTRETSAAEIPGWDSIAHVQLMLLIEEISGQEVNVGATMTAKDIGELLDLFENK
ncbi:hypothetical protein A6U86_05375 [Rhizobium sp. AC27/96]|uniref:hypothetical protein n=1 Tax=Rhizobium sp. AC27/96 TaxID=1841653 RepID=UPI00082910F4|nr:hypothetical protein [Rhizobium sp. AC27/96]OCJ12455.1 hypothetical protein A6U86_05375 [Rhizobium sp. AC27/96]